LAQTPDGYLWIGTAEGLFRFDGFRFLPVLTEQQEPLRKILGLTVDKQGLLWVRAADMRLRQVQRDVISSPIILQNKALSILSMNPSQTEGVYATDIHKSVFHLVGSRVESLPIHSKALITAVSEATDGRLWIGTDRGLLSSKGAALEEVAGPGVDHETNCLLAGEDGDMWVGTDHGLAYWDGHHLISELFADVDMQNSQVLSLMEDRNKNLWVGTSKGLIKHSSSGSEWISLATDGGETAVTALIQDREGDIWFGAGTTLERLEGAGIVPVSYGYPSTQSQFGPLYVDSAGRVWFADLHKGLYWMQDGKIHAVSDDGLADDEVYSIDGNGADVWIGRRNGGLSRLRMKEGKIGIRTWTTRDGLAENSVYAVRVAPDGTIWAGTLTAGLSQLWGDQFRNFSEKDGLPSDAVSAIEFGPHGQVLIGTADGICKVDGLRCSRLASLPKAPATEVYSLLEDSVHGLWTGTSKGLFLYTTTGSRAIPVRKGSQPAIFGLGSDQSGKVWIVTNDSVMSATPNELLGHDGSGIRTYTKSDGLDETANQRRSRSVVVDSRGKVWMTIADELATTGSEAGALPSVIPHVEGVTADGVVLDRDNLHVPAGTKRLGFAFTGLDLHAPSKVRFRYRLDNFDKSWSDVTSDRQATYTNLSPGTYTFRLSASNELNSWNPQESTTQIVVEPLAWQRWSVRIFVAVIFALLVVFAYLSRTRMLLAQANVLAEERLRERTRIARDVHDTVLQGFISSLMHLHVAEKQIPIDSPLKNKFTFVLDGMERVIEEARVAVVGLRTPESGHADLEICIRDFFLEIADIGDASLSLTSTGTPRELKPAASEDLCSIAREAILNAVRHADARTIQVTIAWGWRTLKIQISDDGRGMDAYTLENGRAQHWGLASIRERTKQIKGRLMLESELGDGTKVSVIVPAANVYLRSGKAVKSSPTRQLKP
jgi:ligand-binding sensor domain-containing protein/signal transduction histidine kinase